VTRDTSELAGAATSTFGELIAPLRARGNFSPGALSTFEQTVRTFVRATASNPSEREVRLACELMGFVESLSVEADFQDPVTRATLKKAAAKLRDLLGAVVGSAEPWENDR
jgi:hypothetical protein